ncbi:hypothetical protein BEP19_14860 [Ammoniphilus oxalaticus]|uniref:HK97 gp10 family phage protein n=1 Tax=Ammoniphilus oxalaticus TaxID=66863 RepID=A0A419SCZ3_9BACL|nr:HK97 gp10 family phage protein [Ammoniphilus oxalaticus]RKD20964.1 hypothetical protein BEP19_14860 [Ammoniphilus oxalaticus]
MAKDGISFSLEGIEMMVQNLDKVSKKVDQRLDDTLTKLAHQVITDAKALVGVDSGDLEGSLVVGEVKKEIRRIYIDFGNSPETDDYAAVQHEGFRKTKSGKVIHMSPGPITASKPNHKGFTPGKKYLENALKINEELIKKELSKVLK